MRNLNASLVPESLQKQVESLYRKSRNYYRYLGGYELRETYETIVKSLYRKSRNCYRYLGGYELRETYETIVRISEAYRTLRAASPSEPEWPELRGLRRKLEREIRARREIEHAREKHDAEYRAFCEIQRALR